ncbi:hypothetical protein BJI49_08395 [Acetobacter pasteurianus]|uniref:Uncharacterized protein n=1 Tax=Acetobacter pasteurianus TaxID=438 RepID=A0A1A0DA40_ACEPA|nr:hypothetical protein [Acetobacter pasteurianus]OAZ72148.1 hypothetical protein SRCM100623_01898 [Acetobacter pasteurianus]RCL06586.1 hypothetical protein BJI49_08395 [Acetobacter pasteurianus]GAB31256.1 hypothetical protein APS_1858 [Acetobacter pasteurianus subsp. pasteurianus LMG 1262 = NBRC 106471]GCD48845.1 hypothetical protein NBRC106471_0401 [Acetobacter pasteurianus subsp. pasteurianus LMG 1262 = NBRC 106471]
MSDLQTILKNKVFVFIICLCSILYIFSYLILPFSTADTIFYALIGRSLLQEHILPYQYVFDHKPFGVYVVYGAWDALTAPLPVGKFTVLALLSLAAFAAMARSIWHTRWLWVFAALALLGAPFELLAGNTETLLITTELAVLWLARKGTLATIQPTTRILWLLAAGGTFGLTVNINYLEGICLFLPVCFLLLANTRPILNISLFAIGTCGGLAALFAPYFIQGHHALADYFTQQHQFLHAYSAKLSKRIKSVLLIAAYLAVFSPILIKWFGQKSILKMAPTPDTTLLTLWFVSSVPAALLSGHLLNHYSILWLGPITIMFAMLVENYTKFSIYSLLPLILFQSYNIQNDIHKNIKEYSNLNHINYKYIHEITENQKILNIRAQQSHFYMGHLISFDKYLFHDHIDIVYGKNATQHYLQDLAEHPVFVMLPYKGCSTGEIELSVCSYIQQNYHQVYSVRIGKINRKKPNRLSFELYKLQN